MYPSARAPIRLMCALCGAMAAPHAVAVDVATVREWLEAEIDRAKQLPDLSEWSVTYVQELHAPLSASDYARLRPEVAGRPDHPSRRLVDIFEQRRNGPSVSEATLRLKSQGHWRLSTDRGAESYHDVVLTPDRAWQLNERQLTIVDPSRGWPEGYNLSPIENSVRQAIDELHFGGLLARPGERLTVGVLTVDGDRWSCDIARDNGSVHRYEGRWDESAARGFVESDTTLPPTGAFHDTGFVTKAGGWFQSDAGAWFGRKSETFFPDGTLMRTLRLKSVVREEPGSFEKVTRTPEWNGADALRGPVVATSVVDFLSDEGFGRDRLPDGGIAEHSVESGRAEGRSKLRLIGWATAGSLALFFVLLLVRRHTSTHHGV